MDVPFPGLLLLCCLQLASSKFSSPCSSGWFYSRMSGRCYKFFNQHSTSEVALKKCRSSELKGRFEGRTDMGRLDSDWDREGLRDVWLQTNVQSREPQWIMEKNVLKLAVLEYIFGDIIIVKVKTGKPDNKEHGFYCDFKVTPCDRNRLNILDEKLMEFVPGRFFPNTTEKLVCREGYYDYSGNPPMQAKCIGDLPKGTTLPEGYEPRFDREGSTGRRQTCKRVSCGPLNCNSNYMMEMNNTASKTTENDFNTTVPVTCKRGFVNSQNPSITTSSIVCKQKRTNPKVALWIPISCAPCQPVRCSLKKLREMTPRQGEWLKAVNLDTGEEYMEGFQWNEFNLYNNVATVRCITGYFFLDRNRSKKTRCDVEEQDKTKGIWVDHQFTVLPIPEKCVQVTCLAEAVKVTEDYNMARNFTFRNPETGRLEVLSKPPLKDFPFNSVLNFSCSPGFQTANQQKSQRLECGAEGEWKPHITKCLEVQDTIATGNGKHYKPPVVEMENSESIGAIALIFALLLLGLIIVLDLSTVTRDVQYLRSNLTFVRRYLRERSAQHN